MANELLPKTPAKVPFTSLMDYQMEELYGYPRSRPVHPWQWHLLALLTSSPPAPARRPSNHVGWEETAAAHLYSANLAGARKEEIRVEVEDARYLVIRTELSGDGADDAVEDGRRRSFARKFRLPGMVDADGISAEYTNGVLTVTVPRMHTRVRPVLEHGPARDSVARAA